MAKKIGNVHAAKLAAREAGELANELEVLHPERLITVRGRDITLREYGFVEWVRMRPALQPVLDAICATLEASEVPT
ncbi:hypothetical protein CLD22_27925, partial [Rubrivivax gelatinosus]|nr:hypothetical protein [Rubrivivax gelatinosus]